MKPNNCASGKKALIAEFLGGELARAIGLKVPELVFMNLGDSFSKMEPDEEIQDLLKFSVGLNLGLHFLSSAITYDPLVSEVPALICSKIVILDSLISNIDRTTKNPNLLMWKKELWVIDNGASFYFHHNWNNWRSHLTRSFPMIKDHVLLEKASEMDKASEIIQNTLSKETIKTIIDEIPEEWLEDEHDPLNPDEKRAAYLEYMMAKLELIDVLVKEAKDAR